MRTALRAILPSGFGALCLLFIALVVVPVMADRLSLNTPTVEGRE